mmetsp:Transcript_9277/g.25109  ORF Transcript_9277/g.25109 Transcript_9277/m.25109 type:complete len:349 (-) Transcript_9277:179-1225(-)|eukprot:CAMPEP_0198113222 /NCGR_PEP_ID=MMETSP1442-20131203/4948_1 /TAXON_ID= /ORGANISM="Craspedostauros australis, Strain CCMP3328" /LENGTH=348 /DNA_ID=CAMNT_0043770263 /DNA_START=45 /DNA_END=1091 /DNA_ORIENTATION=+
MSILARVNNPSLVAGLTAVTYLVSPFIQDAFLKESTPWVAVQSANIIMYGLSVWAVSQPGRNDTQPEIQAQQQAGGPPTQQLLSANDKRDAAAATADTDESSAAVNLMDTPRGRTLVMPAGWAFAIWGPIYVGELIMSITPFFITDTALQSVVRQTTGPFVVAQIFQTLWTASFRPKYKSYFRFVSVANLAGVAYTLSKANAVYTGAAGAMIGWKDYALLFLPLSLHFGWTTAASLVDLNGALAMSETITATTVARVGHLSAIAATALGLGITLVRDAPVFGGVIAWALSAVASGVSKRLDGNEDPEAVGIRGAAFQVRLCQVGAALNIAAAVAAAFGWTAMLDVIKP